MTAANEEESLDKNIVLREHYINFIVTQRNSPEPQAMKNYQSRGIGHGIGGTGMGNKKHGIQYRERQID